MSQYHRISIPTSRLVLVAVTLDMQVAELEDRSRFATHLDADVPVDWPPPLNDEASMHWTLNYLREHPRDEGWAKWYFLLSRPGGRPILIGNGGFAGAPTDDGTVELGYSIMESYQRQGFAPEAVRGMIAWAFAHAHVTRLIAHTLPDLRPSIRVLEKCGFRFAGAGSEEGTIRYELLRPW
jgi:RimJ/RimL family protein N-acetyltransferase